MKIVAVEGEPAVRSWCVVIQVLQAPERDRVVQAARDGNAGAVEEGRLIPYQHGDHTGDVVRCSGSTPGGQSVQHGRDRSRKVAAGFGGDVAGMDGVDGDPRPSELVDGLTDVCG